MSWRDKMPAAPVLRHSDGLVYVDLDGRSVVFPSEAAARFFHEAYTLVPALEGQVATLRAQIDEGALYKALNRAVELEARVAQLEAEKTAAEQVLVAEVERRTAAVRRATMLAKTLRGIREKL